MKVNDYFKNIEFNYPYTVFTVELICRTCGQAINQAYPNFCPNCGRKLKRYVNLSKSFDNPGNHKLEIDSRKLYEFLTTQLIEEKEGAK